MFCGKIIVGVNDSFSYTIQQFRVVQSASAKLFALNSCSFIKYFSHKKLNYQYIHM